MNERLTEEAIAQALSARGYRTMTTEQWSRQGALDVIREQRRRNADDPRVRSLDEIASRLADRLTKYVDVPAADMATVLLAAGASVGALALMHSLPGPVISEILQVTGAELDRRATEGGQG
ncbi:hypothetical protein [Streptomyces cylindrosporus]|uniref:Uncharacterized protein n=1 Tax=Streptomyces cylindrosporus TaxID=2927583 RepID=A0ABS9YLQ0_9ACTN|nr:hypothetical protein [Streptomyces cylindrosporus]MCI3277466.1 hypothetical protein [Streptomyces cylindrosporus]